MAYWLMKSEPNVFSYTDLENKPVEEWHGVRNYTARNNMKAMQVGELAFFYHSNIGKEIVGIMKVVAPAHPDSTAEPNDKGKVVWECVDVAAHLRLPQPVTLETIKQTPELSDMALVKLSRLSVSPVTDAEWALICRMAGLKSVPKA
jgi:predicted RNA-binding protein with PUA-like domain